MALVEPVDSCAASEPARTEVAFLGQGSSEIGRRPSRDRQRVLRRRLRRGLTAVLGAATAFGMVLALRPRPVPSMSRKSLADR
jgi:hypothetical protein